MPSSVRTLVRLVTWIGVGVLIVVIFHLGDAAFSLNVGRFAPLTGAFIGGSLTLYSTLSPMRKREGTEPWLKNEQMAWVLMGCGILLWAFGESFWRYYVSIGQTPFPSTADIGYFSFPVLMFGGLLLMPNPDAKGKRLLLLLDSLISMGSILAIAWYLLLGSLAQAPGEANLAKFLGIYYPTVDTALLSCIVFLLLRGQGRTYEATARHLSLQVIGLGLCFFVFSDFIFNVQNNAGTYVEATWLDMGWPLGMMTIGIAAFIRRYYPATTEEVIEQRIQYRIEHIPFGPTQILPYVLLGLLFFTLSLNVLNSDPGQLALRPVLLFATLGVVGMVIFRQILTLRDNGMLVRRQSEVLEGLERANQQIAEQSRQITEHNADLERGIEHLKEIQAQMANGNLKVRARLNSGTLLPLAGSLNLMAERLMRLWQSNEYGQRMVAAVNDLSVEMDRYWNTGRFALPASCNEITEINRLLLALRLKDVNGSRPLTSGKLGGESGNGNGNGNSNNGNGHVTTPYQHQVPQTPFPAPFSSVPHPPQTPYPATPRNLGPVSQAGTDQLPNSGPLLPNSGPLVPGLPQPQTQAQKQQQQQPPRNPFSPTKS